MARGWKTGRDGTQGGKHGVVAALDGVLAAQDGVLGVQDGGIGAQDGGKFEEGISYVVCCISGEELVEKIEEARETGRKEKIVKRCLTGIGNFDLKSGFVMLAEPGAVVKRNKRMAAKSM